MVRTKSFFIVVCNWPFLVGLCGECDVAPIPAVQLNGNKIYGRILVENNVLEAGSI